jgi:phenylalanyl-tRNA synthetase beta chain
MKISLQWLKDYVKLPDDLDQIVDRLTFSGFEVEAIERQDKGLEKVVVGEILERKQHPNADRLSLTKINVGAADPLEIVCGAQNIAVGQKIPVALIGAVIPNGLEIKAAKIRNVASSGMLCSLDELLLPKEWQAEDGIFQLPKEAKVGTPLAKQLGRDDVILSLNITPNRGDGLSHVGIAREIAALFDGSVKLPEIKAESKTAGKFKCSVENIVGGDLCPQYFGRMIEGVKIGPSPAWLKKKLESIGARSINNVVDITAFVMFEMGQPLHAFDADRISSGNEIKVAVRKAKAGEKFRTLADKEVELEAHDLVIAAGAEQRAVALAGVMGGLNSEVHDGTTNVFLEAAEFHPVSVRKTGRRLNLLTDAGYRFERGVDSGRVEWAMNRATDLILELAGGKASPAVHASGSELPPLASVRLRHAEVQKLLGKAPDMEKMVRILRALCFPAELAAGEPGVLSVQVPRWRKDVRRSVDLVEEVGRIWGYEHLEPKLPLGGIGAEEPKESKRRSYFQMRRIRRHFTSLGFFEALNHGFTSPKELGLFLSPEECQGLVELANPVSEDYSVLKPSLLGGLLRNVAHNFAHKRRDLRLFEIRRSFKAATAPGKDPRTDTGITERLELALVMSGKDVDESWDGKPVEVDFFHLKGTLETLYDLLNISALPMTPGATCSYLHPGQSATLELGKIKVGTLGRLHPRVEKNYEFEQPVYALELDLERLLSDESKMAAFHAYGNFPFVERDFSALVKEEVNAQKIRSVVTKAAKPLLKDFHYFDVYKGARVPEGHVSYAFRVTLGADDHTLTDAEIAGTQEKIMKELEKEFQAKFAGLS